VIWLAAILSASALTESPLKFNTRTCSFAGVNTTNLSGGSAAVIDAAQKAANAR